MELGIPRNRDARKSPELKKFRAFVLKAHRCFIKFAEEAVLSWIGSEKLAFDYSKSG